jgi:hypothetical protein
MLEEEGYAATVDKVKIEYPKQCLKQEEPVFSMDDDAGTLKEGKPEAMTTIINNDGVECIAIKLSGQNTSTSRSTSIHERKILKLSSYNSSDENESNNTNKTSYKDKTKSFRTHKPKSVDTVSYDPFGIRSDFSYEKPRVQISNIDEKSALDKLMKQTISSSDSTSSFEYVLHYCGFIVFDVDEVEDRYFDEE